MVGYAKDIWSSGGK